MKAALYLRISQDATGQALGVTRQQEDCAELATALGWDVVEVYVDNDTSATSGKPRPGYRRMLTDIDAGEVEAIIAWHPDRLYRRAVDLAELVEVCKRNNVQVATVKAGTMDLTTPTGRLVAGLVAQVAIYEGEAKADRWRRSVRQRREAGNWPGSGRRMYGWTMDGEVIEDEAETIRWMADEVISGRTLTDLCRELEERGAVTVMGNPWQALSVRQLLTNPRLAGFSTLSRLVTIPGKVDGYGRQATKRVVDIIGSGDWTPILEPDTWETVRAIIASRKRKAAAPRVALLLGLVYCGKCGERMVTGGRGSKKDAPLRTYRCQKIPGRLDGCNGVSISAEPVEELVESYARTRLADPMVRKALERLRAVAPGVDAHEVAQLETRLVELEEQLDEPGVPIASIMRAMERVRERQAELSARVSSSAVVALPVGDTWPPDLTRRRALVDLVVERVTIEPATMAGKFDPERVRVRDAEV